MIVEVARVNVYGPLTKKSASFAGYIVVKQTEGQ